MHENLGENMSNLIASMIAKNDVFAQIEKSRKIMQTKSYEQQTKEFADFILKFSKRGKK